MLCLSEQGPTGYVFGVVFPTELKNNFLLSPITVGAGTMVIKPQLIGEWAGMRLVSTLEPLLPFQTNWSEFIPTPFPDNVCFLFHQSRTGTFIFSNLKKFILLLYSKADIVEYSVDFAARE